MRGSDPQAPPSRLIRSRSLAALGAGAVLVLGLGACGDSDSGSETTVATEGATQLPTVSESRPMTPAEEAVIARARGRVDAYCARVAASLGGEAPPPSAADLGRVTATLDELAALAERAPTAETIDGTSARLALGDIAENLEANNCDSRLVAHIDAALAGLPAG